MEADLLHAGYGRGWGDYPRRLELRTLHAFVEHARPDSALFRVMAGPAGRVTDEKELLRRILHAVQGANWQRAGDQSAPPPELLRFPGEVNENENRVGQAMTADEFHARYPNA